jgi:hypothetical protein
MDAAISSMHANNPHRRNEALDALSQYLYRICGSCGPLVPLVPLGSLGPACVEPELIEASVMVESRTEPSPAEVCDPPAIVLEYDT